MKKRLLSAFLAGSMVLPTMPVAFAMESEDVLNKAEPVSYDLLEPDTNLSLNNDMSSLSETSEPLESIVANYDWYNENSESYTLDSVEDLQGFANLVNNKNLPEGLAQTNFAGKTVLLGENLDLQGYNWTPIDGDGTENGPFAGVFDGQDHHISNVTISSNESTKVDYLGLFARTSTCTIRNLYMDRVMLNGTSKTYGAAVIGWVDTSNPASNVLLENIHVSDITASNMGFATGMVCRVGKGTEEYPVLIENCTVNTASFENCTVSAGIAASVSLHSYISGCSVNQITATGNTEKDYAAGLIYQVKGTQITDCHVSGVELEDIYISGGLNCYIKDNSTIEGCTVQNIKSKANPQTPAYHGGLAYISTASNIGNCHVKMLETENLTMSSGFMIQVSSASTVNGCTVEQVNMIGIPGQKMYAGGLINVANNSKVSGCSVSDIMVEQMYASAGLVRSASSSGIVDCSVKNFEAEGTSVSAGVILSCGKDGSVSISSCTAENILLKGLSIDGGGGFLRSVHGGSTLENCAVHNVEILCEGQNIGWTGGFSGLVNANVSFENCNVENVVIRAKSGRQVGGFTGNVQNSSVIESNTFTNCHVTGLDMKTDEPYPYPEKNQKTMIGGFIGTTGKIATFRNCTVSGKINAGDSAGGFIGDLGWMSLSDENAKTHKAEFHDCVADVDVTAKNSAGGFVGIAVATSATEEKPFNPEKTTALFDNCTAKGNAISKSGAAGGFVGIGDRGEFTNCHAEGAVSGVTAGGFQGSVIPNEFATEEYDTKISFDSCTAVGTVLGSNQAGGMIGSADTVNAQNDKSDTKVEFTGSNNASSVVAGSSNTSVVDDVLQVENEDISNIIGLPEASSNSMVVKPNAGGSLTMDEFGHIAIPESGAMQNDKPLEEGSIITNQGSVVTGGTINPETGSITMKPGGSIAKPDGSTQTFPNGGSVTVEGSITENRPSSSGGSSSSNYSVTANTAANGSVTVSKKYASKGATVTVTTKPDIGYELDKLTVTDKDGKEIKLTNKGSGEFTFEMPASKVSVKATFKKTEESRKDGRKPQKPIH